MVCGVRSELPACLCESPYNQTEPFMMHLKHITRYSSPLIGLLIASCASTTVLAQVTASTCGPISGPGQFGPFDYRTSKSQLVIVEQYHFTAEVEALVRGKSSSIGSDIDYTLRASPNNHRALIAMMRLGEKQKTPQPMGSRYSVQCWFERAITFRPDDAVVHMIYSTYLNKQGRVPEANAQLELATLHANDNAFTHYNIGLHYFDLTNYDKALLQAHLAIALGFGKTELREQLQRVGKWSEPPQAPPASPAPEAPPAPAAASSAPSAEPAK